MNFSEGRIAQHCATDIGQWPRPCVRGIDSAVKSSWTHMTTYLEGGVSLSCWDKHGRTAAVPHKSSPRGASRSTYMRARSTVPT